jgi:hypothetical protein
VKSAKEEALTRMLLFGEWPLLWVLGGNVTHFHEERLHQGKGNVILFPSAQVELDFDSTIECRERLGRPLQYYHRKVP